MPLERRLQVLGSGTEEEFMKTALKVAFASTDMKSVNQHFGAASAFAIYAVDRDQAHLVEVVQFQDVRSAAEAGGRNEDKLAAKIDALEGCVAAYSQAVGASAVAQLKARNIQPVKVSAGSAIGELIASLQEELRSGPNAWLAQAIRRHTRTDAGRFDAMESEGWEE